MLCSTTRRTAASIPAEADTVGVPSHPLQEDRVQAVPDADPESVPGWRTCPQCGAPKRRTWILWEIVVGTVLATWAGVASKS